MGVLDKLPTFLSVCVLVMIFACLKRHTRTTRLTLWAVAWTLVSIHFLAQLLQPTNAPASPSLSALDLAALQASAIAFLVSVSGVVEDRAKRTLLLLILGVPSVSYAALDGYGVHSRWPYVLSLVTCFAGAACFLQRRRRFSLYAASLTFVCAVAGVFAFPAALSGSFHEGTLILLGIGFALPGIFIWRDCRGASPSILMMSGGFFCWGTSFPLLFLISRFAPNMFFPVSLWDTPKLFVALGMILAIVEDKSAAIFGMQRQAELLNRQLERFSSITSRLLTGAAPDALCSDIALAITEVSSFRAAVIHLETSEGTLRIAGSSGLSPELLASLQGVTQHWTSGPIQNLCTAGQRVGKTAFRVPSDECAGLNLIGPMQGNSVLLIPLCSGTGVCLGSLLLAAPSHQGPIHSQELAHVESLAADLAVAVELKSLHTQLVWSEKLAALGQLVAGVAHELNNPLTAIMGFGELMGDFITVPVAREQLTRLLAEARRMKRITDNLLRFSRQSSRDTNAARLSPVVQDVLTLCEYYTRKSNVRVELDVASNLPTLAINEDEIKQILLNLFNNSCDALQSCSGTKQIRIRAWQSGAQAVIQVEDTGPGFCNLHRALDPFYTTKPVGKGTGLGLSVCYGIAKKHGGDLRIENVKPHGGRVTLELPILQPRTPPLMAASAGA